MRVYYNFRFKFNCSSNWKKKKLFQRHLSCDEIFCKNLNHKNSFILNDFKLIQFLHRWLHLTTPHISLNIINIIKFLRILLTITSRKLPFTSTLNLDNIMEVQVYPFSLLINFCNPSLCKMFYVKCIITI